MSNTRAAIRYAKAILDLAIDNNATAAIEEDMHAIINTIADSKELQDTLVSPVISGAVKKSILEEIFSNSHEISKGLIKMLVVNKRIDILDQVALKYVILNQERKGKDTAYITTAVPINDALEQKVLKQVALLTGNDVTVKNKVDERIIGGFVLRVGDLQYDASIASKLQALNREFTNNI